MTCIRRQHTVWTTCPCPPCRADAARMAKLARAGRYTRVPSEVAWAEVDRLRALGWSGRAIASAAGLPPKTIEAALQDRPQGRIFGPRVSAAIVAHGDPTDGNVGATGARRRLQGLARQGWTLEALAARSGVGFSTVAAIRGHRTDSIRARLHIAVRDLAADVGLNPGGSDAARAHAERMGWPGLLAWDDDTIDDPAATLHGAAGRRLDVLAEWRHLESCGVSIHTAARQLGVTVEAIEKAAERAKRRAA